MKTETLPSWDQEYIKGICRHADILKIMEELKEKRNK